MESRIVDVLTELVAIPSASDEAQAQGLLAALFSAAGFQCVLDEVIPGRSNLLARRGTGGTFFCSHADVHPPHAHPEPWTVRRDGDVLVGRGVVDAKGQIASLLAACESERDAPACILITCDEEGGGLGSERAKIPDGPWFEEGGIVLEPTDFRICTSESGNVDVRIEVSGQPAHAYASDSSPLHPLLAAIDAIDASSFRRGAHMNVGRLEMGEHRWRTPATASAEITVGVPPGTDVVEAEAELARRLDEVAKRSPAGFTYEVVDRSESSAVDEALPVVSRLRATAAGEIATMPSWTDAGNLVHHHNLPCVVFGAGDLASAHSDHESVAHADLVRLAETLGSLLRAG